MDRHGLLTKHSKTVLTVGIWSYLTLILIQKIYIYRQQLNISFQFYVVWMLCSLYGYVAKNTAVKWMYDWKTWLKIHIFRLTNVEIPTWTVVSCLAAILPSCNITIIPSSSLHESQHVHVIWKVFYETNCRHADMRWYGMYQWLAEKYNTNVL